MSYFNLTFKVDKKKEQERMRLAGLRAKKRMEEKEKAKKKANAKKNKMNPKPLSRPDKNHKKVVKKLG